MTRRDDIAGALSAVTVTLPNGETVTVDGRPYVPATLSAWQAWPQWQNTVWLTACVSQWTWLVYVILPPGDPAAWSDAENAAVDSIREALEATVAHVDRAEPVILPPGDGTAARPALQFTITTD
jgi:hypothetical protein